MTKRVSKTTRQELIAAILFLLFGLLIIVYTSKNLNFGSFSKPGSGFFPVICGYGITLLSLIWILPNVIGKTIISVPLWTKGKAEWKGSVTAMVLLAMYGLLTDPLGYILATFLFMAAWQVIIVRQKWWKTLLISILSTAVVYIIFIVLLRIYVPKGPLGL